MKHKIMPHRRIRWIDGQNEFENLCRELLSEKVIGFDCETKLDCKTWCLAQFSNHRWTAIVDMLTVRDKNPVRWLTENTNLVKVIHNSSFERNLLKHHNIGLTRVFDTLTHSRILRGRKIENGHNLSAVTKRELGFSLHKIHWRSDWIQRPLPADQFYYAALDAEVLIDLYDIFIRDLKERGIKMIIT